MAKMGKKGGKSTKVIKTGKGMPFKGPAKPC